MFLKKLEISGFKSFAKKTTLDFSESGVFNGGKNIGITAIVGPNGSGKSNIADALRWSMGEQSMKTLRGKKSQDIIFAGSDSKSKLGSAQVSIYLDNSSKRIPVDFEEVVITRKAFRNGDSEYLVNGSRVRLIDVADLLAKGGIGQRSYCIINQGMADQLLNASQLERRAIIEEAAGVKEFQLKKQRSQRKLKSTERNLERVKGLLVEIQPHLKLLKKQSSKAQKGEEYRKELKEKQKVLFGFLWERLCKSRAESQETKGDLGRKMMQEQREVDEFTEKIKKESKNTVSLQSDIDQLEQKQRKLTHELYTTERKIIVEEGRVELEKERTKSIQIVETIPVNIETIKKGVSDIRTRQQELVKRIEGVEEITQLQEIKRYAGVIAQELYELYEAVVKGKIEKKKPSDAIEKQKTLNLKKIHEFVESLKELKVEREKTEKELKRVKSKTEELIKKDKEERSSIIEFEDKLRRSRFELDKLKDFFNDAKIELAKVEVRQEDLTGRIQNEMRISPDRLGKGDPVDVAKTENEIARLKFRLEEIGGMDEAVIEEYDETQKRYDFLRQESEDLKDAMKKLRKVIKQMDVQIKDKFENAFSFINKEFSKYFKTIFNGGKARLEKVEVKSVVRQSKNDDEENDRREEDEDEEETKEEIQIGIEIIAEPPGKKITNLGMLSGGERTLSSIALLFAIISHNPPPFAFLDEIEAALDEANSKRFGRILCELSGHTQFVLITHNRQTMKQASVLYGVTMSGDGISNLLSVKLDQVGEEGKIEKEK